MKLKIYHWIIISFFLGIIAGLIFKANEKAVVVTYSENGKFYTQKFEVAKSFLIITRKGSELDTLHPKTKGEFLGAFQKHLANIVSVEIDGRKFTDIESVKGEESPIKFLSPIGSLFLRLLSFLAIPLVISSMIVGVASLGNIKTLSRIGFRTLLFYFVTTALAVIIGLIVVNIIEPGKKITAEAKSQIETIDQSQFEEKLQKKGKFDFVDFLVNIVPSNPFKAISNGEMLQIIFFAVFVGIGLTLLEPQKSQPIINFFDGISELFIKMVRFVLWFAPFGVFALIAVAVSEFGASILSTLGYYMFTVILGLAIQFFVVYSLLLIAFARTNPLNFFKGMREALIVAFTTSSSAATLPITFKCVEENLGVPNKIASFVLPLGATVNMNGTALYQCVAAVFIAQFYGLDLNFAQMSTILLTSIFSAVGTAPVPGVGIIILIMVLHSAGIPPQGIGLILGVDRILDMLRTIPNVTGDALVSVIVWKMEKNV
ncbi:MAG: Dicarboxylate/amino acid:cation symporter [Candidatus Kapaibacterium sp.]|nr:MAG: Dicarboxylate/amino acid:cation symporter [Candidatus Kapabacteria bacterium]